MAATPAFPAQAPEPAPVLVSDQWLAEQLAEPDLILLHVGQKEAYEIEHIPGARLISVRDLLEVTSEGIRDEMPSLADLEGVFAALGADSGDRFVICPQDGNAVPWAARVLLTLDYLGYGDRCSLLDGGLPVWKAHGHPLSAETPAVEAGDFVALTRPERIVDTAWLSARLRDPKLVLIDARPEEQYQGTSEGHWPRRGHIPGAANIPFFTLLRDDPDSLFKPEAELAAMFADAGAKPDKTLVVYCGTGIWACPVYAVAKHLGYDVRVYDGGFQEWSGITELPVVEPVDPDAFKG